MTDEPQTDTAEQGPTKAELLEHAAELDIEGRSSMTKPELAEAIAAEQARLSGHGVTPGAAQAAATTVPDVLEPTPASIVGRPPLAELAAQRAANRNPRVIGAP